MHWDGQIYKNPSPCPIRMLGRASEKRPTLHTLNAMRVLAEYCVIRHHCLMPHGEARFAMGPVGNDIMSFFFVLSGFVVMYTHDGADFSSWAAKRTFMWKRIRRVYPMLMLNILLQFPHWAIEMVSREPACRSVHSVCAALQMLMLDGWAGCGWLFSIVGVGWYLSCVMWLWLAFPVFKGFVATRVFEGEGRAVWCRMIAVYCIWSLAFFLLWDYDIMTLAAVPALRAGEFLLGCGTACTLRAETPSILKGNRFWFPFIAIAVVYNLQETRHGLRWLCLDEMAQHQECALWQVKRERFPMIEPPCITVAEKWLNKYSLIYACVIHRLARAELDKEGSVWFTGVLSAGIFQTLGKFSLALYLSHMNLGPAVRWLSNAVFGGGGDGMRDDLQLIAIYLASYWIHHAMLSLSEACTRPRKENEVTMAAHTERNAEEEQPLVA